MGDNFEPAPFFWIEEGKGQASTPRPKKKKARKKEFVGWASRELITFLESIGKDTTNALSQYDVTKVVDEYISENKLVHPNNKRRVVCDEKLQALFDSNKKSVFKNKIHDLLEPHLVENQNDSDDDHFGSSDDNDDTFAVTKKLKRLSSEKQTQPKKKAPEVSKSCLVAINSENIKLVYLRKSLVQELLSNPEEFESKVVGSFVRVKSDPYDIFQKNSHQLQQVTGVRTVGDTRSSICLQFSGMRDDVRISEISDDSFTEEEIEDLRQRVKDGLLKQPTIGELEQKVVVLHEVITKHWLARELKLLKNLIDRANEKGWRYQLAENLDKRKLLESSAEQSRLFSEIPKLMPEVVMPEIVMPEATSDDNLDDSPKAADWEWDWDRDRDRDRDPNIVPSTEVAMTRPEVLNKPDGQGAEMSTRSNGEAYPYNPEESNQLGADHSAAVSNGHDQSVNLEEREAPEAEAVTVESNGHTESLNLNHVDIQSTVISKETNGHKPLPSPKEPKKTPSVVIDLSSDDDVEQETLGGGTQIPRPQPTQAGTPGVGIQFPGGGTQSSRPQPTQAGTPGVGIQIPGGGTQTSRPQPTQAGTLGVGIQIPGGGTQTSRPQFINSRNSVVGTQFLQGVPGARPQPFAQLGVAGVNTQVQGARTQTSEPQLTQLGTSGVGTQVQGTGMTPTQLKPRELLGDMGQYFSKPYNSGGNQFVDILTLHPEQVAWCYYDPKGNIQGPFALSCLKRWNDSQYFPPDFKVWYHGQDPQHAVLLAGLIRHFYPN